MELVVEVAAKVAFITFDHPSFLAIALELPSFLVVASLDLPSYLAIASLVIVVALATGELIKHY